MLLYNYYNYVVFLSRDLASVFAECMELNIGNTSWTAS